MSHSTGAGEAVLELCNATVVKNGVRVLDGLTLAIRSGEHTAVLGPNGAGKTALINVLTHDDYALARESPPPVRVFGCDRWNVSELRSRLGIVSADLHAQFANGNCAGRPPRPLPVSRRHTSLTSCSMRCRPAKPGAC